MDATHFKIATHNGRITITNPATGNHRTFRIKTQKDDATFAPGERIVGLLTGPDNGRDYTQFGFVKPDGSIVLWKRYRHGTWPVFADMLCNPEKWTREHDVQYLYEGRCRRCNAPLTNPESISSGIGPVCGGRSRGEDVEPESDDE